MDKFQPGQSGNPAGRRKGSTDRRTGLGKLLEPHAQDLVNTAVNLALSGDVHALKLGIDRLMAPLMAISPEQKKPATHKRGEKGRWHEEERNAQRIAVLIPLAT